MNAEGFFKTGIPTKIDSWGRRGPYSVRNWGDDSSLSDMNERRGRTGDGFDNTYRGGREVYSKSAITLHAVQQARASVVHLS